MRRVCVLICAVAVLLTAEVDVRGNSGVINAVKQRSSAWVHRWQQRVAPRIKARWEQAKLKAFIVDPRVSVLPATQRAVVVVTLCTLLGCAGITQSPENAATGEAVEQQASAAAETPDVKQDEAQIIRTELFGKGFVVARGLTYDSIDAYENNKEKLPLQFYNGMMVHYIKDNVDYVRIVDLIGNFVLKVRHIDRTVLDTVEQANIEGVLVGRHPDYGTRVIAVEAQFLRDLNNGGGQQLLDAIPKETVFYGVPNIIISDGDYVVKLFSFTTDDVRMYRLPEAVRFISAGERLVTITDPELLKQILPSQPQPRQQFRNRPLPRNRSQQVVAQVE